jgi:hypothetical protein
MMPRIVILQLIYDSHKPIDLIRTDWLSYSKVEGSNTDSMESHKPPLVSFRK